MTTAAVVLAAGKGTRFKSDLPKVLHRVAGRSMLRWVLEALRPLGMDRVIVVVGHHADAVRAEAQAADIPGLMTVEQVHQNGTGHAARVVAEAGALDGVDTVLVLAGDSPLLTTSALSGLLRVHGTHDLTILTTHLDDPTGYGRVVRDAARRVSRVVEERDASTEERAIREINTSMYAFRRNPLVEQLGKLTTDNDQGEEYLTDVVAPLAAGDGGATTFSVPAELVGGVNDRAQLADAGTVLRRRILDELMRSGVTVVDPAATYVDAEVTIEPETTLLPGTHLEGSCVIARGATVGPNCRLVDTSVGEGATVTYTVSLGAQVGERASVGPFAYLRPGALLEAGAKAGTYVEIKNSTVGPGSKVPHLSYIGDATIGRDVNVGAGTITCNYDGLAKHPTEIGDGAFIGSDTMLIAPVSIGDGAVTGAGSAIAQDVPAGALAVERAEQRIVEGWADRRRSRRKS